MPFATNKGWCSARLSRCCLVIGIISLIINITWSIGTLFMGHSIFNIEPGIFCIISVCLIVAAIKDFKTLLVPWFVGFLITCLTAVFVFFDALSSIGPADDMKTEEEQEIADREKEQDLIISWCLALYYLIRVFIEILLLRYVYSYYLELGSEYSDQ